RQYHHINDLEKLPPSPQRQQFLQTLKRENVSRFPSIYTQTRQLTQRRNHPIRTLYGLTLSWSLEMQLRQKTPMRLTFSTSTSQSIPLPKSASTPAQLYQNLATNAFYHFSRALLNQLARKDLSPTPFQKPIALPNASSVPKITPQIHRHTITNTPSSNTVHLSAPNTANP
ncbi:MAG: hypothetical protein AAGJ35_16155, partial [Myxococcota bacterium]